jgi:hypothetical protein
VLAIAAMRRSGRHGNTGAVRSHTLSWLGTTTTETNVCMSFTASVRTVQDPMMRELLVATTVRAHLATIQASIALD